MILYWQNIGENMFKNIIPHLVSIKTGVDKINGFYLCDDFNMYASTDTKNNFHYEVNISNDIVIPYDYEFRNGHYFKKGDTWYYKRKVGFITLKLSYNITKKIFTYNRAYSYLPFEIGHILPPGRHLADLIVSDLFLKDYFFIRGCAANYHGKNMVFIAPSYNGKTSLIEKIIDRGGKFISEDYIIFEPKTMSVFPTPCLNTDSRLVNERLRNKLLKDNIITQVSQADKFVFYYNRSGVKQSKNKKTLLSFLILRSMFFFESDFIKSYIFKQNLTRNFLQKINNISKIKVQCKIVQINNYQFDSILEDD